MINIGILGFGTVGKGSYNILIEQKEMIEDYIGEEIKISKILVRNKEKYKDEKAYDIITENIDEIISDDDIDLIIEVTGDVDFIYPYLKKAIKSKKHIITANKNLVSKYFEELMELGKSENVQVRYEAAVAGAIPVIEPLEKIALLNDISSIKGVLNGTCNFILSKMEDGFRYEDALKEAQEIGFAEADPSSDVEGRDTMRKLRILATMAFKESVKEEDIKVEGITDLKPEDIEKAKKENKRYKLVAEGKKENGKIKASVKAVTVDMNSILGGLDGGENAVVIETSNAEQLVFRGLGAGGRPTGFSIVSDLLNIYKPIC